MVKVLKFLITLLAPSCLLILYVICNNWAATYQEQTYSNVALVLVQLTICKLWRKIRYNKLHNLLYLINISLQ